MLQLFYSPGACSLATHIALKESGLAFSLARVDLRTKTVEGKDYLKINPKGYVPALQLETGQVMTECAAILQWVADQAPSKNLLPAWGTAERYKAIEWLNFVATEVHRGFRPLWSSDMPASARESAIRKVGARLQILEDHLNTNSFVLGDQYSLVDAYVFTMMRWTPDLKIETKNWPKLMGLCERVKTRSAVAEALNAEQG